MLFSLPLMSAIQEISARIGRTTGRGIAGNIRRHYSAWLLYPIVLLLVVANTINIGADVGAMGEALTLVLGGPALVYSVVFAIALIVSQIFIGYERYARYLKWLTTVLLSYVATVFMVRVPWGKALEATVLPTLSTSGKYWATFIAVLGTTISPYLFFWQASQETEEIHDHVDQDPLKEKPRQAPAQLRRIRIDTYAGMSLSNLVAFFIMLAAAVTLNAHGVHDIQTSAQAAEALRPIAGRLTFTLFTLGIVGTGLLAVPVLAGSAAYAVGEALRWPTGMDRKPLDARGFYAVIGAATLIGLSLNFPVVQEIAHVTPIKALFWSAVLNGLVAVPIMVVVMRVVANRRVMGEFSTLPRGLLVRGWFATGVMAAAAVGMLVTWKS